MDGENYSFSVSNGKVNEYGTSFGYLSYIPAHTGPCVITCTASNAQGSVSGSAIVNVVAPPSITSFAADSTAVNEGDIVSLTPVFTGVGGFIDHGVGPVESGVPVQVSPNCSTTYTLTVVNEAGYDVTSAVAAGVTLLSKATIATATGVVTIGKSGTATAPFLAGATYSWSATNGTIVNSQVQNITFTPAVLGTCTLTCVITNAAGGSFVGQTTVNVIPAPIISGFTSTQIMYYGDATVLIPFFSNGHGVIQGVGPVSSGVPIVVIGSPFYQYVLVVTNAAGTWVNASVVTTSFGVIPQSLTVLTGLQAQMSIDTSILGGIVPVQWGVQEGAQGGTISQAGLHAAPSTPGVYHIQANLQVDPTISSLATVTVKELVTILPGRVELIPGKQQAFQAQVPNGTIGSVVWAIQEGSVGGSITAAGVYTAPTNSGTYHVQASFGGATATALVVVLGATVGSVEILPGECSVGAGGTCSFTAQVKNGSTAFLWTCSGGTIDSNGNFTAPSSPGTYLVSATVQDGSGASGTASVTVEASGKESDFAYDEDGNMISDGVRCFEWDVENRLVAVVITATGHRSEFGYDGMGRRVQIRELDPDTSQVLQVTSDKKYLWDGVEIAEERDATGGVVQKRFYCQGFVDTDGTVLFYTRDHLGSVRELTDGTQAVRARYDYDPYGRMTKVQGDKDTVFGFTGGFYHAASGLNLTKYRAYNPNTGRWISRDPAGILGGINLYGYCKNNPINYVDKDGRCIIGAVIGIVVGGVAASFDPNATVASVITGAVIGGLIGALDPTEGILSNAAQFGVASAAGNMVGQVINNTTEGKPIDCVNWTNVAMAGIIGGLGGTALGATAEGLGAMPGMPDAAVDLGSRMAGAVGGVWW